jgi:hypothetical protein
MTTAEAIAYGRILEALQALDSREQRAVLERVLDGRCQICLQKDREIQYGDEKVCASCKEKP